jgi:hypothetical protein
LFQPLPDTGSRVTLIGVVVHVIILFTSPLLIDPSITIDPPTLAWVHAIHGEA